MQIDFYLLKEMPSLNLNLEVDFRLYGRHLEKWIAADRPIKAKFGR